MIFAFFDQSGRVREAHNDKTVSELPAGAIELDNAQWDQRHDLLLSNGQVLVSAPAPSVDIPAVPRVVTMRQARLALLSAGLLDAVNAAIQQAGAAAQIEWEYAQTVERESTLVQDMATALGMTHLQLDELFSDAAGR